MTVPDPRLTDDELRSLWRNAGGHFHGPNVEQAAMPEDLWLPLMRSLVAHAPLPVLGDVVRRIDGQYLRSGAEAYQIAVVVSVEPFALISIGGDMLWRNTVERRQFRPVRKATPDECRVVFDRWDFEQGLEWPARKRDWARCWVVAVKDIRNGLGKYSPGTLFEVTGFHKGLSLDSPTCEACHCRHSIGRVALSQVALISRPPLVTVRCRCCGHTLQGSAQRDGVPEYRCPKCFSGRHDLRNWEVVNG